MKYRDFIDLIEEIAPKEAYKDTDNSGVQIYTGREQINRVLVCLEINMDVLEEAKAEKADMILTHHPLIFDPPYAIEHDDYPGRYILEAIKNDICVYSAHLSFDFAPEGNNAYISKLLGLFVREAGSADAGYFGQLPEPMSFSRVCGYVEECLELPEGYIRCVDGGKEKLVSVGWCTGAGGEYLYKAAAAGCDLFITGDVKLHEAQYAKAGGMSVIDAGHYGTEKIFTENMAHQLFVRSAEKGLTVDVIMAKANTNPYTL
ncbi:MAG: Nif3-like dinuclear metal center hexameric protein [Bacillota bacterium]|nr:Nif3-like dinuclear metal center hexameric protein [Bacillota bacterium]